MVMSRKFKWQSACCSQGGTDQPSQDIIVMKVYLDLEKKSRDQLCSTIPPALRMDQQGVTVGQMSGWCDGCMASPIQNTHIRAGIQSPPTLPPADNASGTLVVQQEFLNVFGEIMGRNRNHTCRICNNAKECCICYCK